ncbi:MAG: Uma2 family endonuclease [Candidatus Xenobia bacterium]
MPSDLFEHPPLGKLPREQWPDISHLVTEDDEPVESWYQERQMTLLADTLSVSWKGPGEGRSFLVGTDIGLFGDPQRQGFAPDVILGLDVEAAEDCWEKHGRSWFTWRYGPPTLAAEIVSRRGGGELEKLPEYAWIGVRYVIVWDPRRYLGKKQLRMFHLVGGQYRELRSRFLPELGLGLKLWRGHFRGFTATWLRWCDGDGNLLATPDEVAEWAHSQLRKAEDDALQAQAQTQEARTQAQAARAQAQEARAQAQAAQAQAQAAQAQAQAAQAQAQAAQAQALGAEARAAALETRLRQLGIEP